MMNITRLWRRTNFSCPVPFWTFSRGLDFLETSRYVPLLVPVHAPVPVHVVVPVPVHVPVVALVLAIVNVVVLALAAVIGISIVPANVHVPVVVEVMNCHHPLSRFLLTPFSLQASWKNPRR